MCGSLPGMRKTNCLIVVLAASLAAGGIDDESAIAGTPDVTVVSLNVLDAIHQETLGLSAKPVPVIESEFPRVTR